MTDLMGALALGTYLLFIVLAFGLRAMLHRRRTGSAGFHGISGRVGSAEWLAGVLFTTALLAGLLAPAGQLAGLLGPLTMLDGWITRGAGGLLAIAGITATVLAQQAMGNSWRIGVDHKEATELVTTGPFALVRNPVFATMITAATGLTLLAPNALAILGLIALVVGVQLQVRVVEEPYLRRIHGMTYLAYAHGTGRFLPGIGQLAAPTTTTGNAP